MFIGSFLIVQLIIEGINLTTNIFEFVNRKLLNHNSNKVENFC